MCKGLYPHGQFDETVVQDYDPNLDMGDSESKVRVSNTSSQKASARGDGCRIS